MPRSARWLPRPPSFKEVEIRVLKGFGAICRAYVLTGVLQRVGAGRWWVGYERMSNQLKLLKWLGTAVLCEYESSPICWGGVLLL